METKTKQQKHKERKEKKRKSDSNVKGEQWRVKRQDKLQPNGSLPT
jgi:hypothetical protein